MSEFKMWLTSLSGLVLFVLAIIILSAWAESAGCKAAWEDSGRKYDWSMVGGCRVSDKDGHLIPAKNVRDIN